MPITKVVELKEHDGKVWCVAWSPTGTLLASCGSDKTVRIWMKLEDSWKCISVLTDAHQRSIRSVAWSPCGNFLGTTSFDSTTCIWDRRSGEFECAATLEGHESEVKSVAWSPSGQFLATCSRDKSVWIWEIEEDCEYECASVINSHSQDVKRVLWHPFKDILVSTSYDDTIKFYEEDCDDWSVLCSLASHTSTVWAADFNNAGNMLTSCSDDKTVKIWREYLPGNSHGVPTFNRDPTWKCVCTLSGYHERSILDISWCPSTNFIATACGDNCVRIFQEEVGTDPHAPSFVLFASTKAHAEDVNSVAWNPKIPGLLASCSDDGFVKLWEVKDFQT